MHHEPYCFANHLSIAKRLKQMRYIFEKMRTLLSPFSIHYQLFSHLYKS